MLSVRMRLVLLVVCMGIADIKAASIKKSISESTVKREILTKPTKPDPGAAPTSPMPAIVAIEIINGTDRNASTSKNKKRTIESSLGYGYGGTPGPEPPKKFMIYKYSQHDIPPQPHNQFNGYSGIQKGNDYQLGVHQSHIQHQQQQPLYQAQQTQYYNPATTLYTTLNHQGQLGGLSNNVPYQNLGHTGMVPVIILRVYTNQLASPDTALHTNLPHANPYSSLNSINLQGLLQSYVQHYLQSQPAAQHHQVPDYQQLYQSNQQAFHVPEEYHSNLPTSENYPSKLHTRVIFHSNNNGHIPEFPKSMFTTAGLSNYKTASIPSYKAPQPGYVEVQTPDSQYAFSSGAPNAEQPYMYVYPNQVDQDIYYHGDAQQYQGEAQQYQGEAQQYQAEAQQYQGGTHQYQVADTPETAQIPPTANQGSQDVPYNYHAHPTATGPSPKQRRSRKNTIALSPTTTPKRRAPREKTT